MLIFIHGTVLLALAYLYRIIWQTIHMEHYIWLAFRF